MSQTKGGQGGQTCDDVTGGLGGSKSIQSIEGNLKTILSQHCYQKEVLFKTLSLS
jgi:hypothetical protein